MMTAVRPKVVVLCGSTRFMNDFMEVNKSESMKGHIVLSVVYRTTPGDNEVSDLQKELLDDLHLCKIDLADEVIVVGDGYIGWSTEREIAYAEKLGKPVTYQREAQYD